MLKASREPANPEEAAALYAEIAEKNGISVTKETIRQLLEAKKKAQQTATAQAESAVKQALDEDSLEGIAGGANGGCESTASKGEWCWFSDSCTYVINYYNDNGIEWERWGRPFSFPPVPFRLRSRRNMLYIPR